MPDGKEHLKATNKLWFLAIIIASFSAIVSWQISFWVVYWFWLARYIDNDLDLQGVTSAESRMIKELWIVGALMGSWSFFYAWFVAQAGRSIGVTKIHRSPLTHGVLGTIFRVGFINIPIAGLMVNYLTLHDMKYDPLFIMWAIGLLPFSLLVGRIKAKRSRLPNRFRYGVQIFKKTILLGVYLVPISFFSSHFWTPAPIFKPVYIVYFVAGQLLALLPPDILHNKMDKDEARKKDKVKKASRQVARPVDYLPRLKGRGGRESGQPFIRKR